MAKSEGHHLYPVVRRTVRAVVCLALSCLFIYLYLGVFHLELPKTLILKRIHSKWEAAAEVAASRLDVYESVLFGIEQRNNDVYRSIYGLPRIGEESRYLLSSSDSRYAYLDRKGVGSEIKRLARRADAVDRRIAGLAPALEEVGVLALQAGDMSSCVPGVPPICPENYSLSSRIGYRSDPISGETKYHAGQDIATRYGVPVYATGDGVVETVNYQFTGYGNEIVINHGYGYKSRYAHLSMIVVIDGMKVKRGQYIGNVGNSGKSTGPHLHYEVIYKESRVNPMDYMDMSMDVNEYRQMVVSGQPDSPATRRKSTSEILKRRK